MVLGGICSGGSAPGERGGLVLGGCLLLGGGIPACTEADPPVDTLADLGGVRPARAPPFAWHPSF